MLILMKVKGKCNKFIINPKTGGFHKAEDYAMCVEKRKKEAEKKILKEFKSKGNESV